MNFFAFAGSIDLENENRDEFINKITSRAQSEYKGKVSRLINPQSQVDGDMYEK